MSLAIERLASYFGIIGLVSIIAWIMALVLMLGFLCGLRRTSVCWLALAVALVGWRMSIVNSNFISEIQIDFSQELRVARQRAADATDEDTKPRESDVSGDAENAKRAEADEQKTTADDSELKTPGDNAESVSEVAGKEQEKPENGKTPDEPDESKAATEPQGDGDEPADDETAPAYRQRGVVKRSEGMQVEKKIALSRDAKGQPIVQNVRTMKSHEVAQANTYDRMNLFFARWTFYFAIFLIVVDYFRRFNLTFKSLFPLPLGGRLIDSLFPKAHSVLVDEPPNGMLKTYLERAVRKGETFIYFGPEDPWATSSLERLLLVWSVEKITCTAENEDFDDEFLFESAWFGRYCFVVAGDAQCALAKVARLAEFLELRHATRASAPHTVNVVWELETAIPSDSLDRLANLCRQTNFKLLVATAEPASEQLATCFEEKWSGEYASGKA